MSRTPEPPDGRIESRRSHRLYGTAFTTNVPFRHPVPPGDGHAAVFSYESGDPPEGADGLAESPPAFETRASLPGGSPFLTFHRNAEFDLLRFREVVDVYVRDDLIRTVVHDAGHLESVELYFLGVVLSHWMERQDRPVLHSAVAARNGRSVAFMAGNKSGKSSLTLACLTKGWSLISDDLLPLDERSGVFVAHPGYPELRLWPDAIDALVRTSRELPRVHPAEEKRRVAVGGPDGVGSFATGGADLSMIVLPRRGEENAAIEIRPLTKHEALRELIGGSFLTHLPRALGVDGRRMGTLGRVVARVPVVWLDYPAGWDRLPDVVGTLEAALDGL